MFQWSATESWKLLVTNSRHRWSSRPEYADIGRFAMNDGESPIGQSPCPGTATPRSIETTSMRGRVLDRVCGTDFALKGCVPMKSLCGVPRPCVLSGQDHTHSSLVFVVNPGAGTASPRACSLQPSGPNNFPGTPLRSLPSSRNKFFVPTGPPLRCGRFAVQRARTRADRITPRPRWSRPG
jgi:hypothetical protein